MASRLSARWRRSVRLKRTARTSAWRASSRRSTAPGSLARAPFGSSFRPPPGRPGASAGLPPKPERMSRVLSMPCRPPRIQLTLRVPNGPTVGKVPVSPLPARRRDASPTLTLPLREGRKSRSRSSNEATVFSNAIFGEGCVVENLGDCLQDKLRRLQHIDVPESQDAIAVRFKPLASRNVVQGLLFVRMMEAVQFHDQRRRGAVEVRDVDAERLLPAEAYLHAFAAQQAPELSLRFRSALAKTTGRVALFAPITAFHDTPPRKSRSAIFDPPSRGG